MGEGFGHANTRIRNREEGFPAAIPEPLGTNLQADSPFLCELQCVANQIDKHLGQTKGIPQEGIRQPRCLLQAKGQPLRLGLGQEKVLYGSKYP